MLYTRIQRRTYGSWKSLGFCSFFQRNFQLVSTFLSTFSHFWKSAITIEVFNEKDCSLLSMLYCDSLQQNTFLSFWNVESYYHMFACIRRSKTLSAFIVPKIPEIQAGSQMERFVSAHSNQKTLDHLWRWSTSTCRTRTAEPNIELPQIWIVELRLK